VVLALCAGAACQKAPAPPAKPTTGPIATSASAPPAVKPVPAALPDVVARVNGVAINRGDFERAVRTLEAQAGGPVPPERRDAIYRQLLDQLVALRLLADESTAKKVTVPDTEIDGRLAQMKGQFPNEQAFDAALAERQMTQAKLKTELRQQMLVQKLLQSDVEPTVSVTDADVTSFYEQNLEKFKEPEAVHAAHILIRTPDNADAAAKTKAHAAAANVLAQARRGADFAALAKQYSQDAGSAANGGDLGFVPKGQTVPAFEQAAFALKPGQLSDIVESPFGFHIIKVFEHRAARTVPLQAVKPRVEQFLKQQQLQQKTGSYVDRLKAKAKVEILI
jgi:peptidyl-prolyl cis-trans isomerase C